MSRSLTRLQAVILGLVVLTGVVLGAVGLFAAGARHWGGDAFAVRACFPDVTGVQPGTRVKMLGVDVGEVEAIEDVRAGQVVLRLRVAGKYREMIRKDAHVQLISGSLVSSRAVAIRPGEADEPFDTDGVLPHQPGGDMMASLARVSGDLEQASAKLNKVLDQADRALSDFNSGKGPVGSVAGDLKEAATKLDDVLGRANIIVSDIQGGKGTLGKLYKDDTLAENLTVAVGTVRQMVNSVKQNSDAIKALPVVRSYVVDINKELIRPSARRYRMTFAEDKLFEPGRAVLTEDGKRSLDAAAEWLNERKDEGSDVVVAAFADPKKHAADFAQTLTTKQAEVVVEYLRTAHSVHRMGWWWWSNRTVRAIGCGSAPSPVPEREPQPPSRVELIVFVPES